MRYYSTTEMGGGTRKTKDVPRISRSGTGFEPWSTRI